MEVTTGRQCTVEAVLTPTTTSTSSLHLGAIKDRQSPPGAQLSCKIALAVRVGYCQLRYWREAYGCRCRRLQEAADAAGAATTRCHVMVPDSVRPFAYRPTDRFLAGKCVRQF